MAYQVKFNGAVIVAGNYKICLDYLIGKGFKTFAEINNSPEYKLVRVGV